MVLIEERSGYLQKFEEGNDFCFLRDYLLKKRVENLTQESSVVHKLLFAIVSNDAIHIREILEDYSAKIPTSESQYIYKDLMIFLFICATEQFGLDQAWLLKFVAQRRSEEDEKNAITKTFENLLRSNLESKDNVFEIVIVYKNILGLIEDSETILNETYEKLSRKDFPFYDSDFLNLVALKAIDLIIVMKGVTTFRPFMSLKTFAEKFDKRVKQISTTLFYLILTIILFAQGYIAYKYFWGDETQSQTIEKILTVFSGAAIGTVGFGTKKVIEGFFERRLKALFGRKDKDEIGS